MQKFEIKPNKFDKFFEAWKNKNDELPEFLKMPKWRKLWNEIELAKRPPKNEDKIRVGGGLSSRFANTVRSTNNFAILARTYTNRPTSPMLLSERSEESNCNVQSQREGTRHVESKCTTKYRTVWSADGTIDVESNSCDTCLISNLL